MQTRVLSMYMVYCDMQYNHLPTHYFSKFPYILKLEEKRSPFISHSRTTGAGQGRAERYTHKEEEGLGVAKGFLFVFSKRWRRGNPSPRRIADQN